MISSAIGATSDGTMSRLLLPSNIHRRPLSPSVCPANSIHFVAIASLPPLVVLDSPPERCYVNRAVTRCKHDREKSICLAALTQRDTVRAPSTSLTSPCTHHSTPSKASLTPSGLLRPLELATTAAHVPPGRVHFDATLLSRNASKRDADWIKTCAEPFSIF